MKQLTAQYQSTAERMVTEAIGQTTMQNLRMNEAEITEIRNNSYMSHLYADQRELFPNTEPLSDKACRPLTSTSSATASHSTACAVQELRIEAFPTWYFSSIDASTSEITHLLDILVRDYVERTEMVSLLIPSIIELSLYFQCPEIQIVDAFEQLKRKHYQVSFDANYSKVHISRRDESTIDMDEAESDNIDWRDITHDFYTDVVEPVKRKLSLLFAVS